MKKIKTRQPNKILGQHFLKCSSVIKKIIESAEINSYDEILEIGPGNGVLTIPLSRLAGRVIAVEKDEKLAENLKNLLAEKNIKNVDVIAADILKIAPDLTKYLTLAKPYKVVANIPYYLTSRLIRILTESPNRPKEIIMLIQKEVAERIVAEPPKMNLLALGVKTHGNPKITGYVPASCFWPKPKVNSAIIKISDISSDLFEKNQVDEKRFFQLAKAAFSQKRKVLANSLAKIMDSKDKTTKILEKSGISPLKRPEELSINDWLKIYKNWLI